MCLIPGMRFNFVSDEKNMKLNLGLKPRVVSAVLHSVLEHA